MREVPTVCLAHLSAAELRAYRLADNRLAELAGWDQELLVLELGELAGMSLEFNLEITGFETVDLDRLLSGNKDGACFEAEDDPVPEPEACAISRPGDLWLLGPHKLLCTDALNPTSYEALLGADRAELVFTDPPYNVQIHGHVSGLGKVRHREFAMASGEMTETEFTGFLSAVFANMIAVSTDGAIHFVCMDWRHMYEALHAGRGAYTELKNLCVWNKDNGGMGTFYRSKHELVFVFKSGKARHTNNFGLGEGDAIARMSWIIPARTVFDAAGRTSWRCIRPSNPWQWWLMPSKTALTETELSSTRSAAAARP
jgi:hypothetical protein